MPLTINGVISESPATGISKVGAGQLVLTQPNNYSGTTFINTGSIEIQNPGALGATADPDIQRITTYGAGGTFTITFNGQTTAALGLAPSNTQVQTALNNLSTIGGVGGSVSVTANTVTVTPVGSTSYSVILYTLTFGGTLAGLNLPQISVAGNGNTVATSSIVAAGGQGTVVSAGAALQVAGGFSVLPEALTLNGTGINNNGALENLTGSTFGPGPVTLQTNNAPSAPMARPS